MTHPPGDRFDDEEPRRSPGGLDELAACDEQLRALCEEIALATMAHRHGDEHADSSPASAPAAALRWGAVPPSAADGELQLRRAFDEALQSLRDSSTGSPEQDEMLASLSSMRAEVFEI